MTFFEITTEKNIPYSILALFGQHFPKKSVINEHFLGNFVSDRGLVRKRVQPRSDHWQTWSDLSSAILMVMTPNFLHRYILDSCIHLYGIKNEVGHEPALFGTLISRNRPNSTQNFGFFQIFPKYSHRFGGVWRELDIETRPYRRYTLVRCSFFMMNHLIWCI